MDWVTEKNSSEIDDIAQDLASSQAGLIVLETREWILPVAVISVEVTLDGYRCHTIIEEFILKCIASGVSDLKSQQGIGGLLRLDEVFVERHLQELLLHHLLVESEVGGKIIYELTTEGWDAYQTGLIAATPHNEIVIVTLNAQYELIDTYRDITDRPGHTMKDLPIFRYFNSQEEKAMRSASLLLDEGAFRIAQRQIKELYAGDLVNSVIEIRESQLEQDMNRHFGEIWVYDAVNNQVFCQVWDLGRNKICEKLTFALKSLEAEHRLKQAQKVFYRDVCISPKQPKTLETLYGPAIREAFLQSFNDVRERILIISPCISAIAADDEVLARFRDVVRRKGVIYIGWGGQTIANENRLPAPSLLEKLERIVDAEGAPGVFLFYIGNLANQELLVDQQYHMLGSLHWLSYCGEHIVRNRAVDRIVDKNYVVEQSGCLQGLFLKQLEAQLIEGNLSDQLKCITWFYALLRLNEHSYIREALAEEALEKVIATHSSRTLLNILAVYVKAGEYELGFTRLLNCLVRQESNAELVQWLEKLYIRNPQAYSKITTIYKVLFK